MIDWKEFANNLMGKSGFADWGVEIDAEHNHGSIFIRDHQALIKENLPVLVESLNHLVQLVAKKYEVTPIFFDINNYRRERENLLVELARAAARKVIATKEEISLPAMNSYERRIVHMELAAHPEVVTESYGSGRERFVIVKLVDAATPTIKSAVPEKSNL